MQRIMGRPKDLQKRQAILESATQLFLELGYEGSSMDKIAKLAGVSKLTVYNHFQDKAHLFTAAIELACEQRMPKHLFEIKSNDDVYEVLYAMGCHFLTALYSPEAIKLTLLMSSLVQQNPELIQMFFEAGPKRTHQNIEDLFNQIKVLNLLKIEDSQEAAQLFISLLTDSHYDHTLWNMKPIPHPDEISQKVKQRILMLFKIYPIVTT